MSRAVGAVNNGYHVTLITNLSTKKDFIEKAGIKVIPVTIRRVSINPFSALLNVFVLYRIYKSENPSIVHHVALKPILLGTCAAKAAGIKSIVNAIIGFGFVYSSEARLATCLKPFVSLGLRYLLNPNKSKVVFENGDDLKTCVDLKWVRSSDAVLIRGAGVNPLEFRSVVTKPRPLQVILVARMLKDKGVFEFVEAARLLQGMEARFILVGDVDTSNHAAIPQSQLKTWNKEGAVEWWGFRSDIPKLMEECAIACLPSYREGLPKSLLEAMAAGIPCVTTDVPGCREAVKHGVNGILVKKNDSAELAMAIARLLVDDVLRIKLGMNGREMIEREFCTRIIVDQHLDLYENFR